MSPTSALCGCSSSFWRPPRTALGIRAALMARSRFRGSASAKIALLCSSLLRGFLCNLQLQGT